MITASRAILLAVALASFVLLELRADDAFADYVQQAMTASARGDSAEAIVFATKAIDASRARPDGWLLRARFYEGTREYAKAAADYGEVLRLNPRAIEIWQRRGEDYFRLGKFRESISDFDSFLKLAPERKPYHWQRGIALYYAGRFAEGKQQFELHQTVNPHDVENAVWHFLCNVRANGLAAARRDLIPIEGDARVPMAQVHKLFAGKATPDDVLRAAREAAKPIRGDEPMFYAHLYLGLYFEAKGEKAKAREFIVKAAERSKENGYMGDVARIHAGILSKLPK